MYPSNAALEQRFIASPLILSTGPIKPEAPLLLMHLTSNDPSGIGTGVAILKEADGKTPVVVDNKYWMIYFHGFSGGNMYMAYTDVTGNLLTWTKCYSGSPVLTPSGWEGGGLWTPSFVKVNDKYYIYYQAGSPYKIGFASALSTSGGNPVRPDQTPWTKSPNNPVITNTHGWDVGFCQDPVLRCFDGIYYIFYTGDPPWRNGFAYSKPRRPMDTIWSIGWWRELDKDRNPYCFQWHN